MIASPEEVIGARVSIFWEEEDEWFDGVIDDYDKTQGFYVKYDDGEEQWEPMDNEEYYKLLEKENNKQVGDQEKEKDITVNEENEENTLGPEPNYSSDDSQEDVLENDVRETEEEMKVEEAQVDLLPSEGPKTVPGLDFNELEDDRKDSPSDMKHLDTAVAPKEAKQAGRYSRKQPVTSKALFFRDREHLMDMKNDLLECKAKLVAAEKSLLLRIEAEEQQAQTLKVNLDRATAQSALAGIDTSKKSVPLKKRSTSASAVSDQIMELKFHNRELSTNIEAMQSHMSEAKRRRDYTLNQLKSLQTKVLKLPERDRQSLVNLQLEISVLKDEKRGLERELSKSRGKELRKPTAVNDDSILEEDLDDLAKELAKRRKERNYWQTKYDKEIARIKPLEEQIQQMQARLSEFKGSHTLLRSAFLRYDIDGSGRLSLEEAVAALKDLHLTSNQPGPELEADIRNYFKSMDLNHDGEVDFNEFKDSFFHLLPEQEASL